MPFRRIPRRSHQPELVWGACRDASSGRCRIGGGAGIPLRTVDTALSGCPWSGERCIFVGVWETAGLRSAKPGLRTEAQGVRVYAAAKGCNAVGAFGELSPSVEHLAGFKLVEALTSVFSSSKHLIFVAVILNGVFCPSRFLICYCRSRGKLLPMHNYMYVTHKPFIALGFIIRT